MTLSKIYDYNGFDDLCQVLKKIGGSVVLVGGCFDILHIGHVIFLKKARELGEALVVALESDEKTRELKGEGRPINTQDIRAEVLAALESVDYVLKLPSGLTDSDYLEFTKKLRPRTLAVTKAETSEQKISNNQIQVVASAIGAKFVEVSPLIRGISTSKLAKVLGVD